MLLFSFSYGSFIGILPWAINFVRSLPNYRNSRIKISFHSHKTRFLQFHWRYLLNQIIGHPFWHFYATSGLSPRVHLWLDVQLYQAAISLGDGGSQVLSLSLSYLLLSLTLSFWPLSLCVLFCHCPAGCNSHHTYLLYIDHNLYYVHGDTITIVDS